MAFMRTTLCSLLVSFVAAAGSVHAQAQQAAQPAASDPVFAIDFAGGTLEQYVAAVKSKAPRANIHLDANSASTKISRVSLPNVSVPLALHFLANTAEARRVGLTLLTTRADGEPGEVYVFTTVPSSASRAPDTAEKLVKVYSIQPIDGGPTGDVVRTAVETTIARRGAAVKAAVEFTPANKLLTVTGSRADLAVADQVVEELTRGQRVAAAIPRMQAEIARLRSEVDSLKRSRP